MTGDRAEPGHEFDFLEGEWDAICRVPTPQGWRESPGRLKAERTLDGRVFIERFDGLYHGGKIEGLGLRAYNSGTGEWEHTWTDTLAPAPFHVWKGTFEAGRSDLYADWIESGTAIRSRLTWSDITADSAHWESARSTDGGRTWELHWVIEFRRRR